MGCFPVLVPTLSWDNRKAQFFRDSCVNGAVGAGEAQQAGTGGGPHPGPPPQRRGSAKTVRAAQLSSGATGSARSLVRLGSPGLDRPLPLFITDNLQTIP